jgi:hypothetical protein
VRTLLPLKILIKICVTRTRSRRIALGENWRYGVPPRAEGSHIRTALCV